MHDEPAPITEHLAELRRRLFYVLLALVLCSIAAFAYAEQIFFFLMRPAVEALGEHGARLQAIAPTETFVTFIKCALLAGFCISLPVTFWQVWAFVAPGLYANEKRMLLPFVFVSTALFLGGAVFGYTQVFPVMFSFLSGFGSEHVEQAWTMREVFSTTSQMFLAFGVAFELPVVVFFLTLSGLMTSAQLWRATPYAVVIIFVVAAILTPTPDWMTQLLLAVPMVLLYLGGVGVAYLFEPGRRERRLQSSQVE